MDAAAWDDRYAATDTVWSPRPNPLVHEVLEDRPPRRAVDLACGEGRHARWLAGRGWTVTAVDFSSVGLKKGRADAQQRGLDIEWVQADATTWTSDVPVDLVLVAYLQLPPDARRAAMRRAASALAPGGTLLVVAHARTNLEHGTGGPQDPTVLYNPVDVLADLDGERTLEVVRAEERKRPVDGADRPALDALLEVRAAV